MGIVKYSGIVAALVGGGAITPPVPIGTLRQAMTGSFLAETLDNTLFHAGVRLPVTNKVALVAGDVIRVKFRNKWVKTNVETDGTGTFTIRAAAIEVAGVCTQAALTVPTATPGQTAYFEVTVPAGGFPKGVVYLQYTLSDGGGLRKFPWFTHTAATPSKMTVAGSAVTDNTMVPGGGSWGAVTAGQSFALPPTSIEVIHSGKVGAVMGSSSGVGRNDGLAPGAGIQSYLMRAVDAAGFPCKNLAVSGDQITAMAASGSWRVSELEGVTHMILVAGGNDITAGKTAAEVLAALNAYVNAVKTAWPNIKVMVVTLSPVCSGTFDTLAGQTVHATTAVRVSVNDSIKSGAVTGANAIWDINTVVEDTATRKFKVAPQLTADGTHLNSPGCALVAAMPDVAAFMAT